MHPKIQPNHLEKIAYLYLRQSSPQQLIDHQESRRVQLGLKDKLHEYGFEKVEVIDCDLGKSAAGYQERPGFVKMLQDVCCERVGAVAAWEASRLARNHFEWQNLGRFCQITGTLIIDEDGVYDPTNIDDATLLSIKAALCEYELNMLIKRANAGRLEKAKRGELHTLLASGYYLTDDGRYEMHPNERVRKTLDLAFDKFDELGSVRQALLWFRQERVAFPKVVSHRGHQEIVWELPCYHTLLGVLKNPAYAGAYVYGQRETRTFIRNNQPVKSPGHAVPMEKWKVLIFDHHPAYISWQRFLDNQKRLRENANKLSPFSKGAAKKGQSLLAGLLSCEHCGRKLFVRYGGKNGKSVRYLCYGSAATIGQVERCFSTGARKLEQAVVREVLQTIRPAAITAAIEAEKQLASECSERQKLIALALEQARYEAERAKRQFNAAEPEHRLVARQLEAEWNQALAKVQELEQELQKEKASHRPFSDAERQQLSALAYDLPRLWHLSSTDRQMKKRIIRTLIEGIIAKKEPNSPYNCFTIRWAGGLHSEIRLKRNKRGEHGRKTSAEVIELVKELALVADDKDIARTFNRCGLKTASDQSWNQSRVRWLRRANQLPAFSKKQFESNGNLNLRQAAETLQISPDAVMRLIRAKVIEAKQVIKYAPWIIQRSELEKKSVIETVQSIKKNGKAKIAINQQQLTL